ncbi:DNA cytosine methyltransferase [Nocardia takedensis]|uniref:DNA cytosine methyltransferase n=1 Tax=Nocardia takedensis TaxID=259390 RepID=UPI0002EB964E|nr:DNA cytosine methyltransferase [Nocardia takedensis]
MTLRLLDLYCCAGGASAGYHRAGFEVTGVDIAAQPRYPFEFHRGDALEFVREHGHEFDVIAASPPCQDHSRLRSLTVAHGTGWLLAATRTALQASGRPWVIENVPGAPMRSDIRLCGCMFGLPGLRRERWFETSWREFELRPPCVHLDQRVTVAGHPGGRSTRDGHAGFGDVTAWRRAMGIDWMTAAELAQAIPPTYTEYIGHRLRAYLTAHTAA